MNKNSNVATALDCGLRDRRLLPHRNRSNFVLANTKEQITNVKEQYCYILKITCFYHSHLLA